MKHRAAVAILLWTASAAPCFAYYGWLPPHAALPAGTTCAAQIPVTPEGMPGNAAANATVPTLTQLQAFWTQPNGDVTTYLPVSDWRAVNGGYAHFVRNPSTDMLIRWAACKWGVDEDALRAQAWEESSWNQGTLGDYGTGLAYCTADGGAFTALWDGAGCYASHSIIQMRLVPDGFWSMYPQLINSTGFALDAMGAELRGCINGDEKNYLGGGYLAQYESDQANNLPGLYANCQGEHYSGNYGDSGALWYEGLLAQWEASKPWPGGL